MNDGQIAYKVYREPERKVFYIESGFKGIANIDDAYFFCPYIPGMSDEQIAEANERIRNNRTTKIQIDLLNSIREQPMIRIKNATF